MINLIMCMCEISVNILKRLVNDTKTLHLTWAFCGLRVYMNLTILCLLCPCTRLLICALCSPAGKELTPWLSFVVSYFEFVSFPLVSLVRYGAWLYRFLIFAPLTTLITIIKIKQIVIM